MFWTNPESSILKDSSYTANYLPSNLTSKLDEWDMLVIAGEV